MSFFVLGIVLLYAGIWDRFALCQTCCREDACFMLDFCRGGFAFCLCFLSCCRNQFAFGLSFCTSFCRRQVSFSSDVWLGECCQPLSYDCFMRLSLP